MRYYLFSIAILVSWLKRVGSKPCIPISGKLGIIIGQDYQSILNYTSHFRSEHKNPFGLMGYTTLSGNDGELTGLIDPIDYGSGIEWVDGLRREFPRSSMNLGLYLVDQLDSVIEGRLDSSLDRFVEYIKQNSSCTDFYVRVGYEFDNPSNHYSPHLYIKAFQYIVQRFRAATVRNVLFVWHSMGEATKEDDFAAWFPGTNYVDICGVSIFQQPYRSLARDGYKMPTLESFAKYCQNYKIPLMIAESTPFGGMVTREQERKNASVVNRAGFRGNTWDYWFRPVISFIHSYDVRIWSYINCNWDTLPMWQLNHAPGIYWGDSRIERKYNFLFFIVLFKNRGFNRVKRDYQFVVGKCITFKLFITLLRCGLL